MYEDIDLGPTHRTYSREPSLFPSGITQDNEFINAEPLFGSWLILAVADSGGIC